MIADLDRSLLALLRTRAPAGSGLATGAIDVNFQVPDGRWRAQLAHPTVNLHLYAVHENLALRVPEPTVRRGPDGSAARPAAPARVDCGYAVTAWSASEVEQGTLDEHDMLFQVLLILLANRRLPPDVLRGELANRAAPCPTAIASQDGAVSRPEFWSALDQRPRPALQYVVTLAVDLGGGPPAGGVVRDLDLTTDQPSDHGLAREDRP